MTDTERAAAALAWIDAAIDAISGLEKEAGEPLGDDFEIGRIDDTRWSPSFRIRIGHLRQIAALRAFSPPPADVREAISNAVMGALMASSKRGDTLSASIATITNDALATIQAAGWGPRSETPAARDVLAERRRQIKEEGITSEHDDEQTGGEIAIAAACYALPPEERNKDTWFRQSLIDGLWPWRGTWKPSTRRRDLVKAGSMILAEIERIDRKGGAQ